MASASSRVYMGGLNSKTRESDVEKFFHKYGKLREIMLKDGYGFVEFDDKRDAEDACHDLDGKELLGERLRVEMARGSRRRDDFRGGRGGRGGGRFGDRFNDRGDRGRRDNRFGPPTRTDYRLRVENLSSSVGWQDLKDVMRKGGEVTYADKQGQREGVVEFASKSDMLNALKKCDGMELQGRRIRVTEAGRSGGGRARSRSDSRSRSRSPRARKDSSGSDGSGKKRKDKSPTRSPTRSRSRSRS